MNRITQLHYSEQQGKPIITAFLEDGTSHKTQREHQGSYIIITAGNQFVTVSNRDYWQLCDSGFLDIT